MKKKIIIYRSFRIIGVCRAIINFYTIQEFSSTLNLAASDHCEPKNEDTDTPRSKLQGNPGVSGIDEGKTKVEIPVTLPTFRDTNKRNNMAPPGKMITSCIV